MVMRIFFTIMVLICNVCWAKTEEAIFAGGCFWSMQADFDKVPGVLDTVAGFDGGTVQNPTYRLVSTGKTGYLESVRVIYNPQAVSYKQLVYFFWTHIDPTSKDAQFCDKGNQYGTAIFYLNDKQREIAQESKKNLQKHFKTIHTEIRPSTQFYAASGHHQNYYEKHPLKYWFYRHNCGRDKQVEEVWKNVLH